MEIDLSHGELARRRRRCMVVAILRHRTMVGSRSTSLPREKRRVTLVRDHRDLWITISSCQDTFRLSPCCAVLFRAHDSDAYRGSFLFFLDRFVRRGEWWTRVHVRELYWLGKCCFFRCYCVFNCLILCCIFFFCFWCIFFIDSVEFEMKIIISVKFESIFRKCIRNCKIFIAVYFLNIS